MKRKSRPVRRAPPGRPVELAIETLGARGDGVAQLDGEAVFVAATLPGDRVVARLEGRRGEGLAASLIEVLEPAPLRVAARCPHWGRCGGCSLQHFDDAACAVWKREVLVEALGRAGFD
ncbi:MAG: class I SAM-dependent RNA methyltransferase, partial [Alphaproteobacteria bacterium]|nr:class I SAM-dependent RNA methyltransferase [Alphaproteobacteria bacterium]